MEGFVKLKQTEENNKVKLKLALKGSYNLNQNTVNYQKEVEETKETINFKKFPPTPPPPPTPHNPAPPPRAPPRHFSIK